MKSTVITSTDLIKSPNCLKIAAVAFISITFFYLGKHWVDGDTSRHLLFFSSSTSNSAHSPPQSTVSVSPNFNKPYNLTSLLPPETLAPPNDSKGNVNEPPPPSDSERNQTVYGVVDSDGRMRDDFEVGEVDPEVVESWGNETIGSGGGESGAGAGVAGGSFKKRYELCPDSTREYIPCLDNVQAIKKLKSTEKGERFERHCPPRGSGLDCLVPAPKGYRPPIPWPRSRDEVTGPFLCFWFVSGSVVAFCLLSD